MSATLNWLCGNCGALLMFAPDMVLMVTASYKQNQKVGMSKTSRLAL